MMAAVIANTNGCFAVLGISSRYQGIFFSYKGRVFKTINFFELPWPVEPSVNWPVTHTSNYLWKSIRQHYGIVENVWFAHRLPVFFYELSSETCNVVLDCKEDYDNKIWGRHYDVSIEDGLVVVHYSKKNDLREPDGDEYNFWLAFYGAEFKLIKEWIEEKYYFDIERNSPPFSRYVFKGFSAKGSFVCAFGDSKWSAVKLAKKSWEDKKVLEKEVESFAGKNVKHLTNPAAKQALYSLVSLCCGQGLYAGLPWFHQRWARDELISCNALPKSQKPLVKSILFHWLNKMKGWKLEGTMTSEISDSWLFPRFSDKWNLFNKNERREIMQKLELFIKAVEKENGLLISKARETWMDSIDRPGCRIEVQALVLSSLKFAKSKLESKLKKLVKEKFWTGEYLKDSPEDSTIRPNIFIAAYVYPELLSKKDWQKCFDYILPKLWLDWGGLATIDTSDKRFVGSHSGEDSTSYHNGDSWYWVNNLAAVVLNRFGKRKYKKHIKSIFDASTKEIQKMGAIGHHAEVSSALHQSSSGCFAQAWSAAMYVELCNELSGKK